MPEFDFSELMKLGADLGNAPTKAVPFIRKAVEVTARNIKDDWRPNAVVNFGGARAYSKSVDYEMVLKTDGVIGAEIGPNQNRFAGRFGFLEDANGGVKSAPQNAGRDAAKKNEADFIKGILTAGEDAIK